MDTRTYDALYGPARITPPPRHTGVVFLSAGLWLLTSLAVFSLCFTVGMTALVATTSGASVGGYLLCHAAILSAGAGILVAVGRAPTVRRTSDETRGLILGALALPVSLVLAVATLAGL
ncbi:hypothetical protein HXS80_03525 [Streptomyces sp. CB04723]|uniref:hypothetical protein n=1 Tax=Streptomyces TaxID=1883 RepID=UPI0015C481E5|nr:hypothetical protein [Streptomyces sp. CB04723]QLG30844.1 hypothetical protein HXS80_03525 [Streptomyces sp. CB04723]